MPSYQVKQSSTAYPLVFLMIDSADHITGKTGLTVTVTLSKAGAAFGSPTGAVSEIGSGWYKVAGNATDSGTLGPLALHATATGADPTDQLYEVVAHDVQDAVRLGLTALPNAAAEAAGGLYTRGTGAGQVRQDANGRLDVNVKALLDTAWLTPAVAGTPDVNAKQLGGTAQTGRDVGASVLLSAGAGAGQLDFTSGVVKASLAQILGTAFTEGAAGRIAAAFKQFFNIATPAATMDHGILVDTATTASALTTNNDKTGYALSAAGIQAVWDALTSALTTVGSIGKRVVDFLTGDAYARLGAPAGASVSADVAAVKSDTAAIKSDVENVTTGLPAIAGFIDTEVAAIKAKTDNLPAAPAAVGDIPTANQNADALLKRDWTAVTGEALRSILNALRKLRNHWSTTETAGKLTVYKEDDTTVAYRQTLTSDAAAQPVTELNGS